MIDRWVGRARSLRSALMNRLRCARTFSSFVLLLVGACGGPESALDADASAARAGPPAIRYPEAAPWRYLAQLYVDGLGRLPTAEAYAADALAYRSPDRCDAKQLYLAAREIFGSDEFSERRPAVHERVRTLYRAVLGRAPTHSEFDVARANLKGGQTTIELLAELASTEEFLSMVEARCAGRRPLERNPAFSDAFYGFDSAAYPADAPYFAGDANSGERLEDQLRQAMSALAAQGGGVLQLAPALVIPISDTLVVPENVGLTSFGAPGPERYFRMARLVREPGFGSRSGDLNGPMILMKANAKLSHVYVDGNWGANLFDYDSHVAVSVQGSGVELLHNRIEGGEDAQLRLRGCRTALVRGNLVSGFDNYRSDIRRKHIADGIDNGCQYAIISENEFFDLPGIAVRFTPAGTSRQRSRAEYNRIVNLSNDAQAAFALDARSADAPERKSAKFGGSYIGFNEIWNSPVASWAVVGLVGSRPLVDGYTALGKPVVVANTSGDAYVHAPTLMVIARVGRPFVHHNHLRQRDPGVWWPRGYECSVGGVWVGPGTDQSLIRDAFDVVPNDALRGITECVFP